METGKNPFVYNMSHPLQNPLFISLDGVETETDIKENYRQYDPLHEAPGMLDSAFKLVGDVLIGIILCHK